VALAALGGVLLAHPQLAAGEPPSRPLGVVSQTDPREDEFEAMRLGGVRSYRWLISWPALQPRADAEPDWAATDRVVASLAENRIAAVPFVSGSPCFAVDCAGERPSRAHRQPPVESSRGKLAWAGFVTRLVERYGPEGSFWSANPSLPRRPITQWQIWNEQNAPRNYAPSPSVASYAEVLAIASGAIRSRDPEARIVLGGMFGGPTGRGAIKAPTYLADLYETPGAADHFDAVAVHPYAGNVAGVSRQVRAIRDVIESNGDTNTSIWVTELGWGTSESGQRRLLETVPGQARLLSESFGELLARSDEWNIAGILWYAWRDTQPGEAVCDWCATTGLFDADGAARPAWTAYAELAGGEAVELPGHGDGGSPVPVLLLAGAVALVAAGSWLLFRRTATR